MKPLPLQFVVWRRRYSLVTFVNEIPGREGADGGGLREGAENETLKMYGMGRESREVNCNLLYCGPTKNRFGV